MIKKIYVGKNSSGKTYAMENDFKNNEREKKILVPTEVKLDEEVKSDNKGSGTFIIDAIIPIILEKIDIEFEDIKSDLKTRIDTAIESNPNRLISKFKFNDKWKLEKFLANDIPNEFKEKGSGEKSKYIVELLLELDISGYDIYIDEPEKFTHPSLQIQLACLINNLAINNHLHIVTHSPRFLNELNIENLEVINFFNNRESSSVNDDQLKEILRTIKDRSQNQLLREDLMLNCISLFNDLESLSFAEFKTYYFMPLYKNLIFCNNVIFVEDENTYLYINQICKKNGLTNVDIMYVNGKIPILIFNKVAELLQIRWFSIYDSDHTLINVEDQWSLREPVQDQQYWNNLLCASGAFEITKDIEHSVLIADNVLTYSEAKRISNKKNRLANKLKLLKYAEDEIGSQYTDIVEKLSENFND